MLYTKKIPAVLVTAAFVAAFMAGCAKRTTAAVETAVDAAHTARTSLAWDGEYTGHIPSASGPGIQVSLSLSTDETYTLVFWYEKAPDEVFTETGAFAWEADGNRIKPATDFFPNGLLVGENALYMLDSGGGRITGALADEYILVKAAGN
jgi:uncharacterized lipoprotein NlpE involved in copper resistance